MTQNGRAYYNFVFHPHKVANKLLHQGSRTFAPLEIKQLFCASSAKLQGLRSGCSKNKVIISGLSVCFPFCLFHSFFSTSWKQSLPALTRMLKALRSWMRKSHPSLNLSLAKVQFSSECFQEQNCTGHIPMRAMLKPEVPLGGFPSSTKYN